MDGRGKKEGLMRWREGLDEEGGGTEEGGMRRREEEGGGGEEGRIMERREWMGIRREGGWLGGGREECI